MEDNENRKPRWYHDEWVVRHPDLDKIMCKDCKLRAGDVHNREGKVIISGATKAICDAYGHKPSEILWDGQPCEFYQSEKEPD